MQLLHREEHHLPSGAVTLLGLFASRPRGATQWFRALGTSMVPLLLSGDQILVERCDADDLHTGDVAVMVLSGQFVAHVVAETSPLTTSSYLGILDREQGRVLGRAIAVKKLGRQVPLNRTPVLFGHLALSNPLVQGVLRGITRTALRLASPARRLAFGSTAVREVDRSEIELAVQLASGVLGATVAGPVAAGCGSRAPRGGSPSAAPRFVRSTEARSSLPFSSQAECWARLWPVRSRLPALAASWSS